MAAKRFIKKEYWCVVVTLPDRMGVIIFEENIGGLIVLNTTPR